MSRSEINSASMHTTGGQSGHKVRGQTPSRASLSSTGHGDDGETFLISTASPLTGSVSPAVLSSLLLVATRLTAGGCDRLTAAVRNGASFCYLPGRAAKVCVTLGHVAVGRAAVRGAGCR